MARIEGVIRLFSALMEKSTLLFSTLSCQVISNVTGSTTETLTVAGQLKIFFLKTDGSYAPLFACAEL